MLFIFALSPVSPCPGSHMDSIPRCRSDFYNYSIASLSLVTIVLLIIPKVDLAFFDASAHCLDGFARLSCIIITPESRVSFFLIRFQYLTSHFI